MSSFRVYLKPFTTSGEYEAEFTEVTDDVIKIGDISQSLDNSTYDIGIFRTSGVNLEFRNDHGLYNEADTIKSIFKYKRVDSIIRITWDARNEPLKCGFFKADPGGQLGGEYTVFEGLLEDVQGISKINSETIKFRAAGYEALFKRLETPFSSISNGDNFSDIFYTLLNQTDLTQHVTVDAGNINVGIDLAIDDKSELENLNVKEALDSQKLLLSSSSVLYFKDNILYIADRSPSATSQYTFYGQASIAGIENVLRITNYKDGQNRIFNYVTWNDSTNLAQDSESITKYGVRKLELSNALIDSASSSKINSIIQNVRDEFKVPKTEFSIEVPISYDVLALNLKDKVNVDYPNVFTPADENPLPRWGQVKWGDFRYPLGKYNLTIDISTDFKIMSRKIKPSSDIIIFDVRGV